MCQSGEIIDGMRGRTWVRDLDSVIKLVPSISPCVFLYDQHPLQLEVTLRWNDEESLGSALAVEPGITLQHLTVSMGTRKLIAECEKLGAPKKPFWTVQQNTVSLTLFRAPEPHAEIPLSELQTNFLAATKPGHAYKTSD